MNNDRINLNSIPLEKLKKFAEALVWNKGNCLKSEILVFGTDLIVNCKTCPFYCLQYCTDGPNKLAEEKAKRWLLDLEVRNIIEGVGDEDAR